MRDLSNKVAVFAPYKELYDICAKCIMDKQLNWDIELANSRNIYELGRKYKKSNYQLMISRGGIGKTLKNEFGFEVIEMNLSKEKILATLYKYRHSKQKIAIVENMEFINACKSINNILKIKLDYYVIENINEFSHAINKAYKDGIDVIIGGSYGLEIAETINSYDITYELINSDAISVNETFDKACTFLKGQKLESDKNKILGSIIAFYPKGIIYTDENKIIRNINNYAKKVLKTDKAVGSPVTNFIKDDIFDDNIESKHSIITVISDQQVMLDITNVIYDESNLGCIISFQYEKEILSMENKIRRDNAQNGFKAKYTFNDIIGNSELIKFAVKAAKIFSKIDSTVMITGETGTGKEVFAQAIHNNSSRSNENFVAINCSALPSQLLESELFGYKDGAFTGSRKGGKQGLFELAHKGTLFLDEIGEMDISLQAKLLRVISEREIMKVGDNQVIPVDVRIITATNRNLFEEIEKGNFRKDLYYRINLMSIELPPLKSRNDDIRLLVDCFLSKYNKKFSHNVIKFDDDLMKEILQYEWSGNVRELKNFVEKSVAVTENNIITKDSINIFGNSLFYKNKRILYNNDNISSETVQTLKEIEKNLIKELLEKNNNNKTVVAQILDIDRGTLNRKLQ